MSTQFSFFIPFTPRNITCGVLLVVSMLLFALSFVLLVRAEGHVTTKMSVSGGNNPEPTNDAGVKIIRNDLRAMDERGVKLRQRGSQLRRLAILIFAVFALLAIFWP